MVLWFGSNISCAIARLTSGPYGPPSVELTIGFWRIPESRSIETAKGRWLEGHSAQPSVGSVLYVTAQPLQHAPSHQA